MHYVIFSIDQQANPFTVSMFLSFVATWGAKGSAGTALPLVGRYNGTPEMSYICTYSDFVKFMQSDDGTRFIYEQESFLHVAQGNKMECWLEFTAPDKDDEHLGCMHQVCEDEALVSPSFTYNPRINAYGIAKKGNPDGSYARSVAAFRDGATVSEAIAAQ